MCERKELEILSRLLLRQLSSCWWQQQTLRREQDFAKKNSWTFYAVICWHCDICEVSVLLWHLFWNLSCFQCYQYIKEQFEHSRNFVFVHVWFHPQEVLGGCWKWRLAGPCRNIRTHTHTHTHICFTHVPAASSHMCSEPHTSHLVLQISFFFFFLLSLWLYGGYSPALWIFTNAVTIIINNHTIWCYWKFSSISQLISDKMIWYLFIKNSLVNLFIGFQIFWKWVHMKLIN